MRARKGFTMIELAIVLVIIGLIMGAVLKGRSLIDNAKIKNLVSQVKKFEILQLTFLDRYGRYAGDGDNDGFVDVRALNLKKSDFDDKPSETFLQKRLQDPDAPFAELEAANLMPEVPNSVHTKTVYGGVIYFASYSPEEFSDYNVIVLRGIPCYALKSLDATIDGVEDATQGFVRGVEESKVGDKEWDQLCKSESENASVVYFYDRQP